MKELDLLKKDWKRTTATFEQVSEKEIYAMLHKNSSSVVKWILIISILEVSLWTVLGFSFNVDEYFSKLHHPEVVLFIKGLTYLNYFVVLIFIYLFYKNYQKISAISSTKKLMKDILKTRKTVQYYVWYNLGMIVFCLVFILVLCAFLWMVVWV